MPGLDKMRLYQSWDMTFKGASKKKGGKIDFVVGQVWATFLAPEPEGNVAQIGAGPRARRTYALLLDQVRGQWDFITTVAEFRSLWAKWPTSWKKMVEDKANGTAVANVLIEEIPGIDLVNPEGDKEARPTACEPLFEAGMVLVPPEALHPWISININELLTFPSASHDDTVDTTSQALLPLAKGDQLESLRAANKAMNR